MNYCKYCLEPSGNSEVCPNCQKEVQKVVPPHRLFPGTLLANRYRIGKVLGEGGFGITYVGLDTKLNMKVAVKEYYPNGLASRNNTFSSLVSCSASDDKQEVFMKFRDKFLQEARTLAKFSKEKSIVEVRDFFETNNTAYIIMEYLDGQDLREFQRINGNMPVEKAIQVLTPVMRTLGKIHQQGLIHRDISPDNIRLTPDGVKLLDFGAAREMNTQINRSISVMLKPGYAPEEQYRSKGIQGPWTDVYAVCATIYKCITGVTPDDATQRVYSDELKKPSSYGIKISPAVEEVLLKGMSVFQKDRYKSMDELINALTNALQNRQKTPVSKPKATNISIDKTVSVADLQKNKISSQGGSSKPSNINTPPTPPAKKPGPAVVTPPVNNYTPPVHTPPVDRSIPYRPVTNIVQPIGTNTVVQQPPKKKKNHSAFIIIAIAAAVAVTICVLIAIYGGGGTDTESSTTTPTEPTTEAVVQPPLSDAEEIVPLIYDALLDSDTKLVNSYEMLDWISIEEGVDSKVTEISGSSSIQDAYSAIAAETGYNIYDAESFLAYLFSEPDDFRSLFEEDFGNNFKITCSEFSSRYISEKEGTEYVEMTKNEISENYGAYIDKNDINVDFKHFAEVECKVTYSGTYRSDDYTQIAVFGYVDGAWKLIYADDDGSSPYYLFSLTMLKGLF